MKQPRRRAAWLAAFLLAASLAALPREGAAWPPYMEKEPGSPIEGEPDGPPVSGAVIREQRILHLSLGLIQGRWFILVVAAGPVPSASHQRPSQPSLRAR